MLPGARTSDGALFITKVNGPHTDPYNGGIAVTPDGVIHVDEFGVPSNFANGLGVTNFGSLNVNLSGAAIAGYNQGLPIDSVGNLICQLNQPVSPGDAFVGGVRVGPLGGVYVVDSTPVVPFSFSNGFSGGFDAP